MANFLEDVKNEKMAEINVEEKGGNSPKKNNSKLYIIAIIVILAIIVAWITLSDGSNAKVDIPPEPVVLKDRTGTNHLM